MKTLLLAGVTLAALCSPALAAEDYVCKVQEKPAQINAHNGWGAEEVQFSIDLTNNSVTIGDMDTHRYQIINSAIRPHAISFDGKSNFLYESSKLYLWPSADDVKDVGSYDCRPATQAEAAKFSELRPGSKVPHSRDEPPLELMPQEDLVCGDGKVKDAWVSIRPANKLVLVKIASYAPRQYPISDYMMSDVDGPWHYTVLNLGSDDRKLLDQTAIADDKARYMLFMDNVYMGGKCSPAGKDDLRLTPAPPPPPVQPSWLPAPSQPSLPPRAPLSQQETFEQKVAKAPPPPPGFCANLQRLIPFMTDPRIAKAAKMKCGVL